MLSVELRAAKQTVSQLQHALHGLFYSKIAVIQQYRVRSLQQRRMGARAIPGVTLLNITPYLFYIHILPFEGQFLRLSAMFSGFISPVYDEESFRRVCLALDGLIDIYAHDMVLLADRGAEKTLLPDNCKDILHYYNNCIQSIDF